MYRNVKTFLFRLPDISGAETVSETPLVFFGALTH